MIMENRPASQKGWDALYRTGLFFLLPTTSGDVFNISPETAVF